MEKCFQYIRRFAIFALILLYLDACGGSSGNNSDDESGRYKVSVTVSGLTGSGLVLQNNAEDDLSITSDGDFTFSTALNEGDNYLVTIASQPSNQVCMVSHASGVVSKADVTQIVISCTVAVNNVTPTVSVLGPKVLRFAWNDVGADYYKLLKNPDGQSGYTQVGYDTTKTQMDETISVHLTDWVNASYLVQACDETDLCTNSAPVSITSAMLDAIGRLNESRREGFGYSVAISDDASTLAITSSYGIFIFRREESTWSQDALLKGPGTYTSVVTETVSDSLRLYGPSLSLSSDGTTLAVTDLEDDSLATGVNGSYTDDNAYYAGAVRIFKRTRIGYDDFEWKQQAYIKASNTESDDNFGTRALLSGDGDILAVSACGEDSAATGINGDQADNSAEHSGAVYLFIREGSEWRQQAYIKAANTGAWDEFGEDIALSSDGDILAVGAPGESSAAVGINGDRVDDNSSVASGAIYLFVRDGTTWQQQAYIKASNADAGDRFGANLDLSGSGDLLAVFAPNEDSSATGINGDQTDNGKSYSGAVYLFEHHENAWEQTTYIKASKTRFSQSSDVVLSENGNMLAVGSEDDYSSATGINGDEMDTSSPGAGAVFLFGRSNDSWFQQAYVKASNTLETDETTYCFIECIHCPLICEDYNAEFGKSLGLSSTGRTLVVGAPFGFGEERGFGPIGEVYLY